jgi:hypothetical protein
LEVISQFEQTSIKLIEWNGALDVRQKEVHLGEDLVELFDELGLFFVFSFAFSLG